MSATIVDAVMSLVPGSNPASDFRVEDHTDGKGPQLVWWGRDDARPTSLQIEAELARLSAIPNNLPVLIKPVTAIQARRALRAAGLYDAAKNAVFASSNPDAIDSWEYETVWQRNGVWINEFAAQLGLTSEQVDALFRQAATL